MHYELNIPSRILVGADTRAKVGQEAWDLGWSRVLLVTDPFHAESGRASEIVWLLSDAGLGV